MWAGTRINSPPRKRPSASSLAVSILALLYSYAAPSSTNAQILDELLTKMGGEMGYTFPVIRTVRGKERGGEEDVKHCITRTQLT